MGTACADLSWWAGARLWLSVGAGKEHPEALGCGMLVEMIDMAMSRPEHERPRLAIQMEITGERLSWPDIASLAGRPDRPTMI